MRPERQDIAAPELPPRTRWLGGEPAQMSGLTARGPVLVHFFDFAQLNSVRSLPYVVEWSRRYGDHGLVTLGVHSPRHPFTAPVDALRPALGRLGIEHPVADDSAYALWHDYGCEGWPSLFLWGRGGALRWFHFGEGEYRETELAIQAELEGSLGATGLPEPMEPLRPSDAPGAIVVAPTPEALPGGSANEAWVDQGEGLELEYAAGGVYAAADGSGEISVAVDGEAVRAVDVEGPGLAELVVHAAHEAHVLALGASAGVRVWAISFAAGVPPGE
jgi:hypothetical protein